jgi:hypothetical protein
VNITYRLKNVNFYETELDYVLHNPLGLVGRDLNRRAEKVQNAARSQAGVDTGNLKRSIKIKHGRDSRGQFVMVGSRLNYALAHHQGTRPHIITPTRSQVMVFNKGGRVIYTTRVNHPGTKPNRYLKDNLYLIVD